MKSFGNFSSAMRKNKYLGKIGQLLKLKYILPIIIGLTPALGFAADLFTPSGGDVSLKVLNALFGGLMDAGTGNKADPMLAAIKVFNGGVLIIGGVLAAYTILAGTLGTAHDGEMLGKKFSSVWIPIRYSVGTALVLPVVGGGYCVMQAIVMWLVIQGVGLADQVWESYMSNPTASANTTASTLTSEKMLDISKNIFKSAVCYKSYAKSIGESNDFLGWKKTYVYTKTVTPASVFFGDSKSNWNIAGCGVVNWPKQPVAEKISAGPASTNSGYLGNLDNIFTPLDMTPINVAHKAQTEALVTKMESLADQAIANPNMSKDDAAGIYAQIQTASTAYSDAIKSTALSIGNEDGFQKMKASAGDQGWILAGAWFTRIVQMNERIQAAVNSTPTAQYTHTSTSGILFNDAAKYLGTMNTVLSAGPSPEQAIKVGKSDKDITNGEEQTEEPGWVMQKISSIVTEGLTGMNLYELKNDARHPLIIVHDLGARIVFGTLGLMTAMSLIAGGVGLIPGVGSAVGNVLTVVQMFIGLPVQAIATVALGCQYIIPNLPYMIWIGCIVGWVLLVVESIIAAPLWAIMHLHPNGDDLTGRGGSGYMLVLSLLLRPVLMVFGMMAAIVISSVIGEFINKTFFEVFAMNTGGFTGIGALLALCMGTLLYFIIMFTFIRKCFGIMHQLPDQLLKWIGGGDQALGQFAGEFGGAAEKASGAAAAVGGGLASKGIGMGAEKLNKAVGTAQSKIGTPEGLKNEGFSGFIGRTSGGSVGADGQIRNSAGESAFSNQRSQAQQANADKALDGEIGGGTSAMRDNFATEIFGNNASSSEASGFKQAFTQGITNAKIAGGDSGKAQFLAEFTSGQTSGSINSGNAAGYTSQIGQSVAQSAIGQKASSSFGKDGPVAMNVLNNIAGDGKNISDFRSANTYLGHMNIMQNNAELAQNMDLVLSAPQEQQKAVFQTLVK